MPYINIKLNAPKSEELKKEIVEMVLNNSQNILKRKKEVTSILVEFVPFEDWFIYDKNCTTFYLDIKITKGTTSKDEKRDFIKAIFDKFKELLGDVSNVSYIKIDEISGDCWGYDGTTQEFKYYEGK